MRELLGVSHVLGLMAMMLSLTHVLPLGAALYFDDGMASAFLFSLVLNFSAGYFTWLITRKYAPELRSRDGFLLVSVAWPGGAAFATVPFLLGLPALSLTDAYFESISALTTTGATVLFHLDRMPASINLWRHLLEWIGGMGIIVLAVAVLPLLRVGGMQVYKAEMPGPMKDAKLTPRITETAKTLWLVYAALTLACMVALRLAGMSWFDAICHGFSTMALGGFSTHDASIGFFDSVAIEMILIAFMIVGAINFATHFLALRTRSARIYVRDSEAKALIGLVAFSCIGVALYLWQTGTYTDYWAALRHSAFNVVSIATTCGFASVDFGQWPIFAPMWMLFLACITASAGSTGSGIKMIRTLILVRQSLREMQQLLHPQIANPLKIGGVPVPNNVIFSVLGFIFVYIATVATASLLLLASGLDFLTTFSAVLACINNMGPGLNLVGPAAHYGVLTDFQKWVLAVTMFLGRIEIFSALILLTPAFWRK